MNQLLLQSCSYKDFPKILPIIEAYADIFDFQDKRIIMQEAGKALDEDPKSNSLFLVSHEGSVIGFMGGRRNTNNPLRLDLFCLIIKRGYHGQGVGTSLFQHAVETIRSQGYKQIYVKIKNSYPPHTKDFYRKLGFKPTFDEAYTGSSDEDSAMLLTLEPIAPAIDPTASRTVTPSMAS